MRNVVGLVEKVKVQGKKSISTFAVCDTGARLTSVDVTLASRAVLGPVTRRVRVKNPSLKKMVSRPVVKARILIGGKVFNAEVNLQDRSHMNFPVIIGRNILSGNFLVDSKKNAHLWKKRNRENTER